MAARAVVVAKWWERQPDGEHRRSMAFVITDDPNHVPASEQVRRIACLIPEMRVSPPGVLWETHPVAEGEDARRVMDQVDR